MAPVGMQGEGGMRGKVCGGKAGKSEGTRVKNLYMTGLRSIGVGGGDGFLRADGSLTS